MSCMKTNPGILCSLCPLWIPIPGQDETGLCPHFKYPNNLTYEHDRCKLPGSPINDIGREQRTAAIYNRPVAFC